MYYNGDSLVCHRKGETLELGYKINAVYIDSLLFKVNLSLVLN
jgi:hypothetical protein